ncbi:MAG: ImmA/IrrE family metallo-endopeptidase [Chloroflexi bacterium]|nr:ImmA/IrrE family metallo-endopeptidase [Chloroflexota bacterium]
MSFISPGRLYLQKQKTVSSYEDVLAYAEFLRTEAGLNDVLPVDLDRIFDRFEIPGPELVPLSEQQGLLLDHEVGLIIINSNDSEKRQKFTKAHELVEMLFIALPQGMELGGGWRIDRPGGFKGLTKESLCNRVAANLLMPPSYIQEQIKEHGVNFECAKLIATTCNVSLSAALVQLARNSGEGHFVVLWRMKNKPTEIRNTPNASQMTMFGEAATLPAKKLRVEWCLGGLESPFIPKDKSTESTSLISQAWMTNTFTSGRERMTFDNHNSAWYSSANMPFALNEERHVISLMKKS